MKNRIIIDLPDDISEQLHRIAVSRNISLNELIDSLIINFITDFNYLNYEIITAFKDLVSIHISVMQDFCQKDNLEYVMNYDSWVEFKEHFETDDIMHENDDSRLRPEVELAKIAWLMMGGNFLNSEDDHERIHYDSETNNAISDYKIHGPVSNIIHINNLQIDVSKISYSEIYEKFKNPEDLNAIMIARNIEKQKLSRKLKDGF